MNERLAEILKPLAVPATKLSLRKARKQEGLPVTGTHFGGEPYLEAGEEYPVCPVCENALTFICQIDASESFHKKREGIKLFTFFYCENCSPWGLSDEEAGQWVVRIYDEPRAEKFVSVKPDPEISNPTNRCLADAEKIVIYPSWDEIDYWAEGVSEICSRENAEAPWEAYDGGVKELGGFDDFATTVGGYAFWVQGEEITECDVCGNRMELLAQIDSEEKAELAWGDSGLVYLFFCENHLSEIKLILQCF
jgi:uncharacterized protein YwqG